MGNVTLTAADGHQFAAYTAGPADATRALVVVQEIFGVNRHMRRVADAFAAEGYAVILPALFDRTERGVELGYDATDVARGRDLRGTIDAGKTLLDVLAAAAALPLGVRAGPKAAVLPRAGLRRRPLTTASAWRRSTARPPSLPSTATAATSPLPPAPANSIR